MNDRASSKGIGFVFYQTTNENKPGEDVTIVQANSSGLKDSQLGYSPVDCEVLALKFGTDACYHYLYGAPRVNIYTDCIALQGLFGKPLGDIKNKRICSMIEQMMCFNLVFHHIPGVKNQIANSSPNAFGPRDDGEPARRESVLEQNEPRHQQVGEGV